jgi:hypothetical protein
MGMIYPDHAHSFLTIPHSPQRKRKDNPATNPEAVRGAGEVPGAPGLALADLGEAPQLSTSANSARQQCARIGMKKSDQTLSSPKRSKPRARRPQSRGVEVSLNPVKWYRDQKGDIGRSDAAAHLRA